MTKFKVGDKVVHKEGKYSFNGAVGEVVEASDDSFTVSGLYPEFPSELWVSYYTEGDFELVESYIPKDIKDNVNNPQHYGQGNIECIEYIEDFLTKEEFIGYLRGNIAKYLHRWRYKNGVEDLKKAEVYLSWLVNVVETGGRDRQDAQTPHNP